MVEHMYKYPPSYTQWKRFLAMRQGLLPLRGHENVRVLCLSCGVPVDLSSSHRITIGCVVSIEESIEVTIDGIVYEEPKRKYLPVSAKGAGCLYCSVIMMKVTGQTGKINAQATKDWLLKGVKSVSPNPRQAWIEVEPRDHQEVRYV